MTGDPTLLDRDSAELTQGRIGSAIRKHVVQRWRDAGTPPERPIHNAYAAKGAGKLFELTPFMTLDMQLTSREFSINVAGILGIDVIVAGAACGLCGMLMGQQGLPCTFMHEWR